MPNISCYLADAFYVWYQLLLFVFPNVLLKILFNDYDTLHDSRHGNVLLIPPI